MPQPLSASPAHHIEVWLVVAVVKLVVMLYGVVVVTDGSHAATAR